MEQSRNTVTSGGPLYSSDTPPYLYSGNEQEKLNGLNQYDFHARWLDNAVPRFTTQDPLAEAHYDESPYVYCGNDPVNKVDPLGLDWYYNDPNEFPTYIQGDKDYKNYKYHSKTAYRESANLRYYFGEAGSIMIVEKVTGDAMTYLPQTVVKPSGGYTNYNSYSYGSLNEMMGEGGINFDRSKAALDVGGGLLGAAEKLTASNGYLLGKNGRYFSSTGRGPNQYTGNRAGALKTAGAYKGAGMAVTALSVGIGVVETIDGVHQDGGRMGYHAWHAAASTAGSVAGGTLGAEIGGTVGGIIGGFFGGVGAVPGAVIGSAAGTFILGYFGGKVGGSLGEGIVDNVYGY